MTTEAAVQFAWHVHDTVLLEPLIEPIENRIAYIKANKLPGEQEIRLRLLRPVKGELPREYVRAMEIVFQAVEGYGLKGGFLSQAEAAYLRAWETCLPAILVLHAIECPDCPWDGKTILNGVK